MGMPPPSRSAIITDDDDTAERSPPTGVKYIDVDTLRNSDRIVAVFSQCRWDGRLTFALHREFDRLNSAGKVEVCKTSFVPEGLAESYVAHTALAVAHLATLKERRAAGNLPYPVGGLEVRRQRR